MLLPVCWVLVVGTTGGPTAAEVVAMLLASTTAIAAALQCQVRMATLHAVQILPYLHNCCDEGCNGTI